MELVGGVFVLNMTPSVDCNGGISLLSRLGIAKLYLRTADYSMKKPCGIYEIKSENGRLSYKIFADSEAMQLYLKNNSGKTCETMKPIFIVEEYKEYPNTQVRKLTFDEIQKYMSER